MLLYTPKNELQSESYLLFVLYDIQGGLCM